MHSQVDMRGDSMNKHLILLTPFDFLGTGGQMTSARRAIAGLSRLGWTGWVIYPTPSVQSLETFHSFRLIPLSQKSSADHMQMFDYFLGSLIDSIRLEIKRYRMGRTVLNHNPDACVWVYGPMSWLHCSTPLFSIVWSLLSKSRSYGFVLTLGGLNSKFHNRYPGRIAFQLEEVFQMALAHKILVPDSYILDSIPRHLLRKTELVPNGVDVEVFSPTSSADESRMILYVGRLSWERGPDVLAEALVALKKRTGNDVQCTIAGSGLEEHPLRTYLESHGIRARFLGSVQHSLMPAILKESAIVVNPMRIPGIGNVTLEAMASGRCVIKSTDGRFPEPIVQGENGLLFKMDDSVDLADKIQFALENDDARRRMGANARQTVVEKYSSTKQASSISRELLGSSRRYAEYVQHNESHPAAADKEDS